MDRIPLRARLAGGLIAVASLFAAAPSQSAVLFNFTDFTGACGSTLTCVGNTTSTSPALRLTPATTGASGAGYSTTPVSLGANATFSTTFRFQFTQPGGIDPADGIVFVLAAASNGLGVSGGGIGYQGVGNSVGIEFDTYNNGSPDISDNHVAIDTNGVLTNTAAANPYGVGNCGFSAVFGCMSNGDIWSVTIGYDGVALTVQVQDGNAAVQTVINAFPIDIASLLGTTSAVVGFTAATGSGYENQDIRSWQLANDITLAVPPTTGVPEPLSAALFGIGLIGVAAVRRKR